MSVTWTPVTVTLDKLTPWERNPKRISKTHAQRLLELWDRLGQFQTIAIGPAGEVYDGHQRLSVLKAAHGPRFKVQALQADRALSEKEREELTVAAHVGTTGQFDWDALSGWDTGDLQAWGFDAELLGEWNAGAAALATMLEAEKIVPDDPGPQIDKAEELRERWGVETGQLWQLGEHRLICGDCTDAAVVERVMGGEMAALMVTDPPYGVEYDPKWRQEIAKDNGRWNTNNTTIATGEFVHDNQADWREAWNLFLGDVAYVWSAPGELSMTVFQSLVACDFEIRMQMIWAKQHFVLGRGHYHIQHEPCWYAVRKGSTAHWVGDRTQTTLWEIRNRAAIGDVTKNEEATGHSTQKPIECMERPIRNHDAPTVYDPFLGSGTTLIACERLNRKCRAVEISPAYVAVAIQRWVDMTGGTPVLLDSVQT